MNETARYQQKQNPQMGLTTKERARLAAIEMYTKQAIEQTSNAIGCLFVYLYNVSPIAVAEKVYGDSHALDYLNSKADEIRSDPVRWYGTLDYTSQRRLASAVVARYADTLVQSVD